jgi:hypothetical protein
MATVPSASHAAFSSVARRSYLATETYNTDFFSYAVTFANNVYTGALSAVVGATTGNCPAGRILHETGKKLYPSANPGIAQYMVSVFDPVSMLTGFINPNNPTFSLMNTDRPAYIADSPSGTGTGVSASARANALYTRGDVLAGGRLDISGNTVLYGTEMVYGNVTMQSTLNVSTINTSTINSVFGITATKGQNRVTTVTTYTSNNNGAVTINPTLSQVFKIDFTGTVVGTTAIASSNESLVPGGIIYIIVTGPTGGTTIDFGNNFRSNDTGSGAGNYVIGAGQINTYAYICDGTNFYQIANYANLLA